MNVAALIYPHQLFDPQPALTGSTHVYIIEDPLYFSQYAFHRQKLMLHRASMKRFADNLLREKQVVKYVDANKLKKSEDLSKILKRDRIEAIQVVTPEDDYLNRALIAISKASKVSLKLIPDPHFLTSTEQIDELLDGKQRLFFTNFYISQRKRLGILLDSDQKPIGGKWSFDTENRKKLPKGMEVPEVEKTVEDTYTREAREYVSMNFSAIQGKSIGDDEPIWYPTSRKGSLVWLRRFVADHLSKFGDYEDAITTRDSFLFHSVLTPMLNIGLLSPQDVVNEALILSDKSQGKVPLNSLEGFIRQVIGWREYMRAVYRKLGRQQRTRNYWAHTRKIPSSFYDGTTGILPIDVTIKKILRYGYCHHIERLMVLGNFMLLCEFDPDEIYRWFMELFIDAYDWVMVPNVYGMSQYADGGLITTKPYISGSSYVLRMSDFGKSKQADLDWCAVWDGLYWRFMDMHRDFFKSNPRMSVMTTQLDKMGIKLASHHRAADTFLKTL